jgi:hypothetical protein
MSSRSIAVCIIADNQTAHLTRYCLTNLLEKTSVNIQLFLYDISSDSSDYLHNMFLGLSTGQHNCYFNKYAYKGLDTVAKCRNSFLDAIKLYDNKYAVYLPVNCMVNKGWDNHLINSYEHCVDAGILSIRNGNEKLQTVPLLHHSTGPEPVFKPTWHGAHNFVHGILFFSVANAAQIGPHVFGIETGIGGFEDYELCYYANKIGQKVFYIAGSSVYCLRFENDKVFGRADNQASRAFRNYVNKLNNKEYGQAKNQSIY